MFCNMIDLHALYLCLGISKERSPSVEAIKVFSIPIADYCNTNENVKLCLKSINSASLTIGDIVATSTGNNARTILVLRRNHHVH